MGFLQPEGPSTTGVLKLWQQQVNLYEDDDEPVEAVPRERTSFRLSTRERQHSNAGASDTGPHWKHYTGIGWGLTHTVQLRREQGKPLGLGVGFQNSLVFVNALHPDTPAAAVLQMSDRIISINGEHANQKNIAALMPKETTVFSLELVRDDADQVQQGKEETALTKVQSMQRGKLARVEAQRRRWVIVKAVIKLQACVRGRRARSESKQLLRQSETEMVEERFLQPEELPAVRMTKQWKPRATMDGNDAPAEAVPKERTSFRLNTYERHSSWQSTDALSGVPNGGGEVMHGEGAHAASRKVAMEVAKLERQQVDVATGIGLFMFALLRSIHRCLLPVTH